MPKRTSSKIPDGAMIIRTYAQLHAEVDAFAHGERNLLIIIGPPRHGQEHRRQDSPP